mgnify:CR=1 FL=1
MLKLVLGGSGSGKTTLLYSRIRARAEAGRYSILLVPEQFTSSTEGRIYRELGDALSGMVESFSFTSLAEKILSTEGGAAVQTLSDAGRAVLVRRALEELIIEGYPTTADLAHLILYHPEFVKGTYDTGFLEQHMDELLAWACG